jgi:hypothetical protein
MACRAFRVNPGQIVQKELSPVKRLKLIQKPGCPTRHLTQNEIEAICTGRTDPVITDWREHHLLLCRRCLQKAELELETLRELRMALGSFPAPAGKHRAAANA